MTKRWHPRLVDTRTRARDTPAPHPPADPTMRRVTSPSRLSPHDWASALLAGPAVEPPPPEFLQLREAAPVLQPEAAKERQREEDAARARAELESRMASGGDGDNAASTSSWYWPFS